MNTRSEVVKRDGSIVPYQPKKVRKALESAFISTGIEPGTTEIDFIITEIHKLFETCNNIPVEVIQDTIEYWLMKLGWFNTAKAFILYREKHKEARFIKERIDYMNKYSESSDNAASLSETDSNANVTMKNVANLESEVYKTTNRIIQRQRMKDKLNELYPEVAKQYEKDLNHHIIYTHDEASTPVLKQYCMAVSLYPLMTEGVGNIDGVTPSAPNDLSSFSGQITNLAFLLSSQCKGAVAFGEYFIALNYYVRMEFGNTWYNILNTPASSDICNIKRTVKDSIIKAFKQFVWGINQPAQNRAYQSPFTNISYYDKTYFESLFKDFYYPDGTQPTWKEIDILQRMFMKWFNKLRLKQVLAFPVETFAMVHNGNDIVDKEYKELCAEMYSEGHSFFTYISDSADSLASCCRLRNELAENTFNPTSGLTGVMTGSCNVITLNINRIVQDWANSLIDVKQYYQKGLKNSDIKMSRDQLIEHWYTEKELFKEDLQEYLINSLDRVYKYHIAYKTMLYDLEDKGMFAASNGGYIYINKLYSTIGINGLNEAARFLGLDVSNNKEYIEFLQFILNTIKEQNKAHNINDKKRPFLFNSEVVPAEGLGGKNYKWDLEDGYFVPDDINLYNSYFYNAHDNTSVLDKFILHGKQTVKYCDGGSALHCNLQEHLSKEQYLKLIDIAIAEGTNYFTFNIPNTKCNKCGYIAKQPFELCPKCESNDVTHYTRIIGYMRPINAFAEDRKIEAEKRIYGRY